MSIVIGIIESAKMTDVNKRIMSSLLTKPNEKTSELEQEFNELASVWYRETGQL